MSQERLNGLEMLAIEKDMIGNIDVDIIIDDLHIKMLEETAFYDILWCVVL